MLRFLPFAYSGFVLFVSIYIYVAVVYIKKEETREEEGYRIQYGSIYSVRVDKGSLRSSKWTRELNKPHLLLYKLYTGKITFISKGRQPVFRVLTYFHSYFSPFRASVLGVSSYQHPKFPPPRCGQKESFPLSPATSKVVPFRVQNMIN